MQRETEVERVYRVLVRGVEAQWAGAGVAVVVADGEVRVERTAPHPRHLVTVAGSGPATTLAALQAAEYRLAVLAAREAAAVARNGRGGAGPGRAAWKRQVAENEEHTNGNGSTNH